MKTCPHCGKANQPTRKYCIRCGKNLIKSKSETPTEPKAKVPDMSPVSTETSIQTQQGSSQASVTTGPASSVTTEDRWVRPSEVSRDRVRSSRAPKVMSELEKAKMAFKRAEEVGIEEIGSGVVETRMVRASEVQELLDHRQEIMDSAMTPEQPPAPPETKPQESLGEVAPSEPPSEEPALSAKVSHEFRSSRYQSDELGETDFEVVESAVPKAEEEAVSIKAETARPIEERVTTCPNCGTVHGVDDFEYPDEVYSAMGTARLKRAKMLIIKGEGTEASKDLQIAISFFMRAENKTALEDARRLLESVSLSWD